MMGTCILNADDIAEIFHTLEFESHCEGDFDETDFITGARIYLAELRAEGADIKKEGSHKKIKNGI